MPPPPTRPARSASSRSTSPRLRAGRPLLDGVSAPGAFGRELAPRRGYAFRPFTRYQTGATTAPYRTSAGNVGAYRAADAYNYSRFAFFAAPASPSFADKVYLVNEDNTIWAAAPTDWTTSWSNGLLRFDGALGGTNLRCDKEPSPTRPRRAIGA
jgi:hypothetical protein